jgi:hypothetical protein
MALLKLYTIFVTWATLNKLPVEITAINDKIPRLFQTHTEHRAIDISTRGWTYYDIAACMRYFSNCKECQELGAISARTSEPTPLVYHRGTGWHFHLQVRRERGRKLLGRKLPSKRRKRGRR